MQSCILIPQTCRVMLFPDQVHCKYKKARPVAASTGLVISGGDWNITCSRKASMLSSFESEGEPPANFIRAETTTRESCATRSAALSHVSSAARNHRNKLSSMAPERPGSTDRVPLAKRLAIVSQTPWSHLRWPSSCAITACFAQECVWRRPTSHIALLSCVHYDV